MLSNPQKALLKRAQREIGLTDEDYREALETVAGVRSSTAPALTDRPLDKLLAYFEAIHWLGVDAGRRQPSCKANAVFLQRGYWARKNTNQETSRDRFTGSNQGQEIAALEHQLADLGCNAAYCAAIRKNVTKGRTDARALHLYRTALERTLRSKARALARAADPF